MALSESEELELLELEDAEAKSAPSIDANTDPLLMEAGSRFTNIPLDGIPTAVYDNPKTAPTQAEVKRIEEIAGGNPANTEMSMKVKALGPAFLDPATAGLYKQYRAGQLVKDGIANNVPDALARIDKNEGKYLKMLSPTEQAMLTATGFVTAGIAQGGLAGASAVKAAVKTAVKNFGSKAIPALIDVSEQVAGKATANAIRETAIQEATVQALDWTKRLATSQFTQNALIGGAVGGAPELMSASAEGRPVDTDKLFNDVVSQGMITAALGLTIDHVPGLIGTGAKKTGKALGFGQKASPASMIEKDLILPGDSVFSRKVKTGQTLADNPELDQVINRRVTELADSMDETGKVIPGRIQTYLNESLDKVTPLIDQRVAALGNKERIDLQPVFKKVYSRLDDAIAKTKADPDVVTALEGTRSRLQAIENRVLETSGKRKIQYNTVFGELDPFTGVGADKKVKQSLTTHEVNLNDALQIKREMQDMLYGEAGGLSRNFKAGGTSGSPFSIVSEGERTLREALNSKDKTGQLARLNNTVSSLLDARQNIPSASELGILAQNNSKPARVDWRDQFGRFLRDADQNRPLKGGHKVGIQADTLNDPFLRQEIAALRTKIDTDTSASLSDLWVLNKLKNNNVGGNLPTSKMKAAATFAGNLEELAAGGVRYLNEPPTSMLQSLTQTGADVAPNLLRLGGAGVKGYGLGVGARE